MVKFDYSTILHANNAYAVLGNENTLDSLFNLLRQNDLEDIYEEAGISKENRDIGYGTVKEFDMSSEAQECINYLGNTHGFSEDVLIRIKNVDDASEEYHEQLEHRIKEFHEKHSYDMNTPSTCVLVSGTDRLTKYDSTLSGRLYTPPELQ